MTLLIIMYMWCTTVHYVLSTHISEPAVYYLSLSIVVYIDGLIVCSSCPASHCLPAQSS